MLNDDNFLISAKTKARAAESINKVGYAEGAADGQSSAFQSSFDIGYQLGFEFGLQVGYCSAIERLQGRSSENDQLLDPRRINCQLCTNVSSTAGDVNVVNLYNTQKEKNNIVVEELDKT